MGIDTVAGLRTARSSDELTGLAFEKLQLDIGADFSDLVDTVSLSANYSF